MVWVDVVRRYLELFPYLAQLRLNWADKYRGEIPPLLADVELKTVQAVFPLLDGFQKAFCKMEGEVSPLMSEYYPVIVDIMQNIVKSAPAADPPIVAVAKEVFVSEMVKYFETPSAKKIALLAAFLDPRKGPAFVGKILLLSDNPDVIIEEEIVMYAIYCDRKARQRSNSAKLRAPRPLVVPAHLLAEPAAHDPSVAYVDSPDGTTADLASERRIRLAASAEIAAYRASARVRNDVTVWEYWQAMAPQVPILSTVARCVFAAPPTSASVERSFSATKALLTAQRRAMSSDTLETLARLRRRGSKNCKRTAETLGTQTTGSKRRVTVAPSNLEATL